MFYMSVIILLALIIAAIGFFTHRPQTYYQEVLTPYYDISSSTSTKQYYFAQAIQEYWVAFDGDYVGLSGTYVEYNGGPSLRVDPPDEGNPIYFSIVLEEETTIQYDTFVTVTGRFGLPYSEEVQSSLAIYDASMSETERTECRQ